MLQCVVGESSPSVGLGGYVDRRGFLSRGAVGVSGIIAAREASGEVPREETLPDAERSALPPDEMDAYLATMDAGAGRLAAWPIQESFPGLSADRPELVALSKAAMHSLYVAGMFGDLPLENQVDRRVQDRLWESQPLMDEALSGIEKYLDTRTTTELADVRETLRNRPEVLHTIIGTVDARMQFSSLVVALAIDLCSKSYPLPVDAALTTSPIALDWGVFDPR